MLALVLLVALYATFLFLTVRGAMAQRAATREGAMLAKEIVDLEGSYGSLKESITMERAKAMGLVPLDASRFASRDEAVRLTLAR